jgi:TRAP-type C4-dicarboxylate transport system substrate-binding protein
MPQFSGASGLDSRQAAELQTQWQKRSEVMKNGFLRLVLSGLIGALLCSTALADPLDEWKPKFDPKGAQYTYLLSNITHPAQEAAAIGYHIRDKVWERSGGRLYVDYRPLAQLGGERDVISKVRMGAVQGMILSNVAAVNINPKFAFLSLPYLLESYEKLEKFRHNKELFDEFRTFALPQGLMTVDLTGYGSEGWATTQPVRTVEEARSINFRIAEAPVIADTFKAWGLKFTVMPWPDVAQALHTGVINGLDQTAITCSITKKFEVAKHFTEVNYIQGLFIHFINKRWFDKLPADLQKILIEVIEEESAKTRLANQKQEDELIAAAKAGGVQFYKLSAEEEQKLKDMALPLYDAWGPQIGKDYLDKMRKL